MTKEIKKKIGLFFLIPLLNLMINIRWAWFHIHPHYVKFSIGPDESHFQNVKTGEICSNYSWEDV